MQFNVAFIGLLGRDAPITDERHAGVHRLHPPGDLSAEPDPQPRRLLTTPDQAAGRDVFFMNRSADSTPFQTCNGCHVLDPRAAAHFGQRRVLELRLRDAALQDPAPSQPVPEGRHVRACRLAASSPGDNGFKGDLGARLRLPPRRQRRHPLPLHARDRVRRAAGAVLQRRLPSQTRRRPDAAGRGVVPARLRQQHEAGRRAAGRRSARRRSSTLDRASICSTTAPPPATATSS